MHFLSDLAKVGSYRASIIQAGFGDTTIVSGDMTADEA
jgi:hypothetical protein